LQRNSKERRRVAPEVDQSTASGKGTVVPDWGNKDLKRGIIRGILKQLGIDIKDFEKA
jgi:hypothetical protein